MHGPDDGHLVHVLGHVGQVLADLHAVCVGLDRLHWPLDTDPGFVPTVSRLAHAARHVPVDPVLRRLLAPRGGSQVRRRPDELTGNLIRVGVRGWPRGEGFDP